MDIIYIGFKPQVIRSGGDKYLTEVLDYLEKEANLKYMDFSHMAWLQKGARFSANFNAVICILKANLWAVKEFIKINKNRKNKYITQHSRNQIPLKKWGEGGCKTTFPKKKFLQGNTIVLINSYYKQFFFMFVWFIKLRKNYKYVAGINALYYHSRGNRFLNKLDKFIMKIFLLPASAIIVNSKVVHDEVRTMGINVPVKVISPRLDLPPDIPEGSFNKDESKFNILYVGYCTPVKELHILVEAIGLLKEYPIQLNIVGEYEGHIEYYSFLKSIIAKYDIADKVCFHGRKEGKELTFFYKTSDLLVSPGSGEGYGRVLIEAMYFGLAVVGANSGATTELIQHGVNGLLFSPKDPQDLSQKIKMLIADKAYRSKLAANARKESLKANFTVNLGKQFYEFFKTVNTKYGTV